MVASIESTYTFNDVQPLPRGQSPLAREPVEDPGSDEVAESAG